MATSFIRRWRKRPRIGAKTSIAVHLALMILCIIVIRAEIGTAIAWVLFVLNAIGAAAIGIKLLTDPLFDDDPFGPFAGFARWWGADRADTPIGRFAAWLRKHGLLE